MKLDPRKLGPSQLVQLLNSTPLGTVLSERQLFRHRNRAGARIGDGRTVDLLRYVAWLALEHQERRPDPNHLAGYDAHRERARARNAELSLSGRDIGELPPLVNPERRTRSERDFRTFCESYFAQTFHLPWSDDHLKVIGKIERAVLEGGLFAMAMPRGSGKTSLCEIASLWALVHGHREYVALIGADEQHAANMLGAIKSELENNPLLLEDFPEVVFPVQCLEGITQRAGGQLYQGRPTHMAWTAREAVLPTIPGSRAAGGVISVAGITGRIRGLKHKRADGTTIRPALVLIDDPQTDESARSPSQCEARERVLAGAVWGLAGPGRKIAGLMTLTVVRKGDLADRLLDRERSPDWQAERTKMVFAFPSNQALWDKYAAIRAEELRNDRGIEAATEFYRQRQAQMDAGAVIAWPARHHPDELSAVQHAMNLRFQNESAFFSEYQNDPLVEEQPGDEIVSAEKIAERINGHPRAIVPPTCTQLTMFIDIQKTVLYWLVAGWEDDFTGYVIDYGAEPGQAEAYFTLRNVRRTLQDVAGKGGLEASIFAGLQRLVASKVAGEWKRADGVSVRIDRCLIDANWGLSTEVVYEFCRQSPQGGIVLPSHGRYVGAARLPFGQYTKKPGDRTGLNWRVPAVAGRWAVKHALYDSNFWKSFLQARLAVPRGDRGGLTLFGKKPDVHRMLCDHLASEISFRTEGLGRTVDEWRLRLAGSDNHYLDCLVGCAVAASMQGVTLVGEKRTTLGARKRVSFARMQREARERQLG